MGFSKDVFSRLLFRRQDWSQDAVYDCVFMLRILLAVAAGIVFGYTGCQGLPFFIGHLIASFIVVTSWLNYSGIDTDQYDSESSPLHMEGLPQAVSLFLLVWITSFTLAGY